MPHLYGIKADDLIEAAYDELQVCTWCQAEIDGVGRTYYSTLDEALAAFGGTSEGHRLIMEHLKDTVFDQIWIPASGSYVALGFDGIGVAWAGKTVVYPSRGARIELPGYAAGAGGGTPLDRRIGDTCANCFMAKPLTGVCPNCD